MNRSSAKVEPLDASWRMPAFAGVPIARQALRWLFALPECLGVAIAVVALFSLVVLGIAAVYGAPLTVPRERMSVALGYSAVVPVAISVVLYVVLRLCRLAFARSSSRAQIPLPRMIANDTALMGLFLVATYFHFSLKTWVPVINSNLYDDAYFAVDRELRSVVDLCYWIRTSYFTAVPNTDVLYQAAFLFLFITGFCYLAVTRNPVYPRFCVGVLLTLTIGALSYLIAPALGPFVFEQGLNHNATAAQADMLLAYRQVKLEGMPWIARAGASHFTGGLAAMPSLHITHAIVMTWFIFQARSTLFGLFLPICFWVVVESIASRWHYLIDLPAGALLAIFIIWLTCRLCPMNLPRPARSKLSAERI